MASEKEESTVYIADIYLSKPVTEQSTQLVAEEISALIKSRVDTLKCALFLSGIL